MNFRKLAETRQSCRDYDVNRVVSPDIIEEIIRIANLAPSACNAQPYKIYALQGQSAEEISKSKNFIFNKFIENCTSFIVIEEGKYNLTSKIGSQVGDQDYKSVDIGIVTAYIDLAAKSMGLDSCIIGAFDEKRIKEVTGAKSRIRIVIALGYAKEGYPLRVKKRKEFEDICKFM